MIREFYAVLESSLLDLLDDPENLPPAYVKSCLLDMSFRTMTNLPERPNEY